MTIDALHLGIGLLVLIFVNIILGSIDAFLSGNFDRGKFLRGIIKGIIVALCFAATYLVGWLTPSVLAISINGQAVNLLTAVYLVIMAGFLFYAKEVIMKLAFFVNGNLEMGELVVDDTVDMRDYVREHGAPPPIDTAEKEQPTDVPEGLHTA